MVHPEIQLLIMSVTHLVKVESVLGLAKLCADETVVARRGKVVNLARQTQASLHIPPAFVI